MAATTGAQRTDQSAMRRHHLALVAALIRDRGGPSRSELAATTGLNKVTVSSLINDLIDSGLVEEGEPRRVSGRAGRPTAPLMISETRLAAVAAEINVDHVTVSATSLLGTELATATATIDGLTQPPDQVVAAFLDALDEVYAATVARGRRVTDIVVGVPGIISASATDVVHAPYLRWRDVPVVEMVRSRLGESAPPVRLDRLSNLAAMAELAAGAGAARTIGLLYGNYGVGGTAVVDGTVLRGATGYGGDIGHIQIDPNGPLCACGRRGCLQAHIGIAELLTRIEQHPSADPVVRAGTLEEKVRAAADLAGTPAGAEVRTILAGQARWLARGAAVLIQVLSPELIVLGGHYTHLAPHLLDGYSAELSRLVAPAVLGGTTTVVSALGMSAPMVGALHRICDGVIGDPASLTADRPLTDR